MNIIRQILKTIFIGLIRFYQCAIARWLQPTCRHMPSCSNYAIEAIKIHGPVYGLWLTMKRISKCHPCGTHGYDPVPSKEERESCHVAKNL